MAKVKSTRKEAVRFAISFPLIFMAACFLITMARIADKKAAASVPRIEASSMDLTINRITLGAKWDLLIRIPEKLPSKFVCLQGDIQASLLYKNITLATSSKQRYNDLTAESPQQLKVSASISGDLIRKNILQDIRDKKEVSFVSHVFLTDCREKTKGILSYVCEETTLRFEQGSEMEGITFWDKPMNATRFWYNPMKVPTFWFNPMNGIELGENPTCTSF